jgi:hypothetical protein
MPEPKDLHIDQLLTNMSLQYRNEAFIWQAACPVVKVNKRSDKIVIYNKEDSFKIVNDALGPKALPNEVDWGTTTGNYSVKDHGLSDWLPQEAIDNADSPLTPEADTNDFLNLMLDLAQEERVAALIFLAGSYPSGNKVQLTGQDKWGGTTDDPIDDLLTAIEGCFVRANTVIMGADVWKGFRKLPEVLDAVKGSTRQQGTPGGLATIQEMKDLFEVPNWIVGRSRYVTTKEGQTATYARLWGKHVAALYVDPRPGLKSICFGLTLSETLKTTYRDFDGRRGVKGAHYFKVAWNEDTQVIASDLGYFIEDAVA